MRALITFYLIIYINFGYSQDPTQYASYIDSEELKTLLYTYASDDFLGREAGTNGQKIAVEFLKNQYIKLGIAAAKSDGDYYQKVPLKLKNNRTTMMSVEGKTYSYFGDFISDSASEITKINTDSYAYVGHGINDENHNDYKNLDIKGKLVVAIVGEPVNFDGVYAVSGTTSKSKWSSSEEGFTYKKNLALKKGAKGFILIDNYKFIRYAPYYKSIESKGEANLTLDVKPNRMFSLLAGKTLGAALIQEKNGIYNKNINIEYKNNSEPFSSENVIAVIKGNERPDEYIIISAHLDHIGIHDGSVFNGADDDGSGTVAILEIAQAFQNAVKNGHGPKRSIVFLHLTAEEKGLLGSQYYTDHNPVFELEKTVANLNIDMIGRTDPKRKKRNRNYIYLIGSDKLSKELHEVSEMANNNYSNLELDYTYNDERDPNRFYYRSDHYNFAKKNIPVIFYFNGTHEDYHKATDTADKIQYDLLESRSRLIFFTAWELANREERIRLDAIRN